MKNKLESIFDYMDKKRSFYIEDLSKAVSLRSEVCAHSFQRTNEMIDWIIEYFEELGIETIVKSMRISVNGKETPIPAVVLGTLGKDPKKRTVCAYGYVDVQHALLEDAWDLNPFQLNERDEKLYGKGTAGNKGAVLSWIHVVGAFQALNQEIPVNLKFILEGMGELCSKGVKKLLLEESNFFNDIDFYCLTQYSWLSKHKPCLIYSLRGVSYFFLDIDCASENLHSGTHGGSVYEALSDLIYMLDTLVDKNGKILITGMYENIPPVTEKEMEMYKTVHFEVDDYRQFVGATKLRHDDNRIEILMNRWRYPSLSIHGIEYANSTKEEIPIIPKRVVGKFSIRFAPTQTVADIDNLVKKYLDGKWKKRGSSNNMKVINYYSCEGWKTDPSHPHFLAAQRAIHFVYGRNPDYVCEGGDIAMASILEEISEGHIIVFPLVVGSYTGTSQKEHIGIQNYIDAGKVIAAYFYEISLLEVQE